MGPNGMQVIESASDVIKEQTPTDAAPPSTGNDDDEDDDEEDVPAATAAGGVAPGTIGGFNTIDILTAVSDSAEEGLALLSNWFGLNTSGNATQTTVAPNEEAVTEVPTPAEDA